MNKTCSKITNIYFPDNHSLNVQTMTTEQLNTELQKGYTDMLEGRTENAKVVFDDIRNEVHY